MLKAWYPAEVVAFLVETGSSASLDTRALAGLAVWPKNSASGSVSSYLRFSFWAMAPMLLPSLTSDSLSLTTVPALPLRPEAVADFADGSGDWENSGDFGAAGLVAATCFSKEICKDDQKSIYNVQ